MLMTEAKLPSKAYIKRAMKKKLTSVQVKVWVVVVTIKVVMFHFYDNTWDTLSELNFNLVI